MTTPSITTTPASPEAQAGIALEVVAAETDRQLKVVLRPLEVLAATTEARSGDWQGIRPLLAVLEEKEPAIRSWYALPDGSYYTVVDNLTGASLKDRSYFPDVLAGRESVGTVVVSKSTGRNAVIVAVPVMTGDTVTGVLGASVYLDTLTDTLREKVTGPFIFYAIDTENRFALHSDTGQIFRNLTTIGPLFQDTFRWGIFSRPGFCSDNDGCCGTLLSILPRLLLKGDMNERAYLFGRSNPSEPKQCSQKGETKMTSEYKMYINREWVEASDGQTYDDRNPYTGEVFARVAAGKPVVAKRAVEAAAEAFPG